ncbi:calmodulin-binding receptor-like cytoplasmic kinase 2 isoform X2 [Pyrus x bretschneideri]|uniref:calmodulin-binding receptor-like cytoplasmic kinase 2 isoform X2 n=1 Tax=Pyrus x bretschneideri TaxID=225117 RepID=UPI002030E62C|nr:calmodulin-binding receptor-like cytoplasmic kinase 2 isoform X2 [Pyrus x bretschneideri]
MRRTPSYGSRNPTSDPRSTPDRIPYSPSSPYSLSSTGQKSSSGRSVVSVAARSVAGAFISCFTPPETKSSVSFGDSEEFKAPSDASRDGSERRRSSSRGIYSYSNNSRHGSEPGILKFTMEEINKATKNFSPSFKIGQGGFGTVYKGRLGDGTLVAIKRAKKSVYDKHLGVEFQSEIQMLAQVEHLNLVKFYGYLEHEDEKIVVVEYVPNGTLRQHLECLYGQILDLAARLDIAIDVAHAVTYLHMYTDHPIIHRDIKSSNILLTENFRAKVADFGFARFAADSDSGATHVSTQVKGTAGYLDPEYLRTYQLTEKSDVFSFGVLLVELVTGRRPIEAKRDIKERITAKWAMKKFTDGDALSILDPRLEQTEANNLAIEKILELALQCLAPRRQNRPSMRRCAEILWSIRKDYKEVLAPDFRSFSSRSQMST